MKRSFVRLIIFSTALMLNGCAHIKAPQVVSDKDRYVNEKGDICMTPWYFENVAKMKIDK